MAWPVPSKAAGTDQLRIKEKGFVLTARENCPTDAAQLRVLVAAARHGDQEAFTELYRLFFPLVHGILLSRLPVAEIEDISQEVFLQAWCQLPSLRDFTAFGGWLAQMARRRSVDYFRRYHHTQELSPDLSFKHVEEESWFLLSAIKRLPEAYRETLILRFVEGLTGPEIAMLTNLTPDSVRVNLHRGVKLLRKHLNGESLP